MKIRTGGVSPTSSDEKATYQVSILCAMLQEMVPVIADVQMFAISSDCTFP
jgi:hypothetical protein